MKTTDLEVLKELWEVVQGRKKDPKEGSYTNKLLSDSELIFEKLEEELGEMREAVENGNIGGVDEKHSLIWESSDFLYHLLVLLASQDADLGEVLHELKRRRKT